MAHEIPSVPPHDDEQEDEPLPPLRKLRRIPESVLSNRSDFLYAVKDWRSMNTAFEEVFDGPSRRDVHIVHASQNKEESLDTMVVCLARWLSWKPNFLSDLIHRLVTEDLILFPPNKPKVDGYVLGIVLYEDGPPRYTVIGHDDYIVLRASKKIKLGILKRHMRWWKMLTEWHKAVV